MLKGYNMNAAKRVDSLTVRHSTLDDQIRQEMSQLVPNETKIKSLKVKKLEVKDEIFHLQNASA